MKFGIKTGHEYEYLAVVMVSDNLDFTAQYNCQIWIDLVREKTGQPELAGYSHELGIILAPMSSNECSKWT